MGSEEENTEKKISELTVKANNQQESQAFDGIIDQVWRLLKFSFYFIEILVDELLLLQNTNNWTLVLYTTPLNK